ncbi:MAG TPA: hypothetical protein VM580_10640 [Labilithrix sp.]|jgi:hypothetical protein|nr:hypothetical protein [Labilithrix sp.]
MDQEHRAARGALVLYNFTSVPIFAPKETLLYRYLVVVVNLCTESPSKRAGSIELSEGDAENPLRVVRVGTASVKAERGAARKGTAKTRKITRTNKRTRARRRWNPRRF